MYDYWNLDVFLLTRSLFGHCMAGYTEFDDNRCKIWTVLKRESSLMIKIFSSAVGSLASGYPDIDGKISLPITPICLFAHVGKKEKGESSALCQSFKGRPY